MSLTQWKIQALQAVIQADKEKASTLPVESPPPLSSSDPEAPFTAQPASDAMASDSSPLPLQPGVDAIPSASLSTDPSSTRPSSDIEPSTPLPVQPSSLVSPSPDFSAEPHALDPSPSFPPEPLSVCETLSVTSSEDILDDREASLSDPNPHASAVLDPQRLQEAQAWFEQHTQTVLEAAAAPPETQALPSSSHAPSGTGSDSDASIPLMTESIPLLSSDPAERPPSPLPLEPLDPLSPPSLTQRIHSRFSQWSLRDTLLVTSLGLFTAWLVNDGASTIQQHLTPQNPHAWVAMVHSVHSCTLASDQPFWILETRIPDHIETPLKTRPFTVYWTSSLEAKPTAPLPMFKPPSQLAARLTSEQSSQMTQLLHQDCRPQTLQIWTKDQLTPDRIAQIEPLWKQYTTVQMQAMRQQRIQDLMKQSQQARPPANPSP